MKLSKTSFLSILIIFIFSSLTGFGVFALKKWGVTQGILGPEAHPFLYIVKSSHYLLTPFLVFILGTIYVAHIKKGIDKVKKNKKSGIMMLGSFFTLMLSGQFLLFLSNEDIKYFVEIIHLNIGILVVLAFSFHVKKAFKRKNKVKAA